MTSSSQNTVKKYTSLYHDKEIEPYKERAEILIKRWLLDDRMVFKKQHHTIKRMYERLTEDYNMSISYSQVQRLRNSIINSNELLDDNTTYIISEENEIFTKGVAELGVAKIQYLKKIIRYL